MQIDTDTLILVADGGKALFLRNEGDEKYLNLQVEQKKTQDNPPNREQAANRRGRMFDGNGHKSAVDDTDWHELAKDRFAGDLADMLYKRAHRGDFEKLVVIASPSTLGEIRDQWHQEVSNRIIAEIDKNVTNHPVDEIEAMLQSEMEAA